MKDSYCLEELQKTFSIHIEKAKEHRLELIEKFKENNPFDPVPDHLMDDFNLPAALKTIVSEILVLKAKS